MLDILVDVWVVDITELVPRRSLCAGHNNKDGEDHPDEETQANSEKQDARKCHQPHSLKKKVIR